jgi:hypothetical protein
MTDLDFSIEIERLMRKAGCLGIFRIFGQSMEIFMGSVLTGNNAAEPSPYSFALGGAGLDYSIPGGANRTPLKEGQSVMVDMGGNFYGYISDMSRVYSIGKLSEEAYAAHQTCLKIQKTLSEMIKPKAICEDIYAAAIEIAEKLKDLQISSWGSTTKHDSWDMASDWKSMKSLSSLHIYVRSWNQEWSSLSSQRLSSPMWVP